MQLILKTIDMDFHLTFPNFIPLKIEGETKSTTNILPYATHACSTPLLLWRSNTLIDPSELTPNTNKTFV